MSRYLAANAKRRPVDKAEANVYPGARASRSQLVPGARPRSLGGRGSEALWDEAKAAEAVICSCVMSFVV